MRFFKSFKLLHRRTKSDPAISLVPVISNLRWTASSSNNLPKTFLTVAPDVFPVPHPNSRILDLQTENARLGNMSAAVFDELAGVKAQLTATQADLFAELHRGARQRQDDQNEIRSLRQQLAQYEELIIAAGSYAAIPASADFSHILDQALSNVVDREANLTGTKHTETLPSLLGPHSQDAYMSALQLTLKSRSQLKQCKKIVKFWKRTAQEDERNVTLVTPSASTISSIFEVLPAERQRAVDDLIASRRMSIAPSLPEHAETTCPVQDPAVTENASAVGSITPSRSLPQGRPCLSPLASQSLRQELNRFASTNRLVNWPYTSKGLRKPLEQFDLNVRSYHAGCEETTHRSQAPLTLIPMRDRQRFLKRRMPSGGADPFTPPESSQSLVDHVSHNNSMGVSSLIPNVMHPRPYPLSNINEEAGRHSQSSFSSVDTNLEWVSCQKEDLSFGSNTETLITATLPTRVTKEPCRKTKSKIPLPVFKALKRLSSTKWTTMIDAKELTESLPGRKSTAKQSPTRLPVRSR